MILILTIENDVSTNHIIDWLDYYKTNWTRINQEEFTNINHKNILDYLPYFKKAKVVWYRKWKKQYHLSNYTEIQEIEKFLFYTARKAFWLNRPEDINITKQIQLDIAVQAGLLTPKTIVTNNKKELTLFKNKYNNIICKKFTGNSFILKGETMHAKYTERVNNEDIKYIPDSFE